MTQADELESLRDKVLKLLGHGLLPDGAEVVDFDGRDLHLKQAGLTLPPREFSDGYRTVTALACDLLRQMHRCYGSLDVDESQGSPRVMHEGVVLIDEIETHMHVSWQKRIGFWLKEHFPSVQFIVTTHSPFICQAADAKGLIRIPAPGEDRGAEHVSPDVFNTVVNGDADDAVMTALFGVERPHSPNAERLRRRIAQLEVRLINGVATAEEKQELSELSAQLPKSGSALVEQALRKLEEMR